jgi:hypothetical protein
MELIQNADDNTYLDDGCAPTLCLTYKSGILRIDCNEKGFSRKNVEALCSSGRSTKKCGDNPSTFIGEKGMGFKSVFKVADVVGITSGFYSFKFDKRNRLGMIRPIWEKFEIPKQGWTSIYLWISSNDPEGLIQEMKDIGPEILLFLRKLRVINLSVDIGDRGIWKTSLRKLDSEVHELMTVLRDDTQLQYVVKRHVVNNLPSEPKRPNCRQSEILLAFPILKALQPVPQKVFSFLPIRDYGFTVSRVPLYHPFSPSRADSFSCTLLSFFSAPISCLPQIGMILLIVNGTGLYATVISQPLHEWLLGSTQVMSQDPL